MNSDDGAVGILKAVAILALIGGAVFAIERWAYNSPEVFGPLLTVGLVVAGVVFALRESYQDHGLWWTIYKVPLVVAGFASVAFGVLEYLRRKAPDDGTWFLGVLGLAAVWGLWSLGDWLEKLPARRAKRRAEKAVQARGKEHLGLRDARRPRSGQAADRLAFLRARKEG